MDGIYGSRTRAAVIAAQQRFGLPETGVVDDETWDELYDQYAGIETAAFRSKERFPYSGGQENQIQPRNRYAKTSLHTQFPGMELGVGFKDPVRQEVVR